MPWYHFLEGANGFFDIFIANITVSDQTDPAGDVHSAIGQAGDDTVKLPLATNIAASLPINAAALFSSRLTVGSSPKPSLPTSAVAMASRIAAVGLVQVSLRSSMILSMVKARLLKTELAVLYDGLAVQSGSYLVHRAAGAKSSIFTLGVIPATQS